MRALLHVVSVICLLPSVLLACAFLALGHAIAAGTLLGFFEQLLDMAIWLIPWGLLIGLAVFFVLLSVGFSQRLRRLAGSCVVAFAIGSVAVILAFDSQPLSSGQLTFFAPALLSASIGLWLAAGERPRGQAALSTSNRKSP